MFTQAKSETSYLTFLELRKHKMARFDGKTVVVTGAGSGIGREVSLCFATEGATVIALDISCPMPFEESNIHYRKHDVRLEEDWNSLVTELSTKEGADCLVNSAGIMDYAPLDEVDLSSWRRTMAVDLDGVMLGMRAIIPLMKERGGSIVNISSVWGLVAVSGCAAYHAAKAAVTHLTRNAAVTYAPHNIRANAIHPGIIATPLVLKQPDEFNQAMISRTPLGRMGKPVEIAKCVLFMASDDASFMTGAAIAVDGGWTAQ
ncbi:uncharacterized protein TRUGW13939_09136 [Talaromyces rugulosus]|uniref:Uncharacterized protein n=1 Tax=Talaromyces rugulosus TaxID=121627 RepID=A0A7H8R6J2_TALRU|nr:uncharacterized protein TRUGW13939_09136 [Talaromyces rugulosus]QKX61980.1 hypothetical protein TRUGW13939_09136 [Talaromyces rugulosus]